MLQRARRVLFCVTACLASVVTRCSVLAESSLTLRHDCYGMIGECCLVHSMPSECNLVLRRAQRVLFQVTACLRSAVLCYSIIGKCCLTLQYAWQVLSHVKTCSASAVLRSGMLGK